jgi:glucose-1-phosphate cytidylyltransferase
MRCISFSFVHPFYTVFEKEPLVKLSEQGELMSYMHKGFWQCMDNKREKDLLEKLLKNGKAPWKKWED